MDMLSVGEAKIRLAELISRAAAGETIIIQQDDQPVAALIGAAKLGRLSRVSPDIRPAALAMGQTPEVLEKIAAGRLHPAMVAFGMWKNEEDLENLTDEIYTNRLGQVPREVSW